jgi:hypothetical protein
MQQQQLQQQNAGMRFMRPQGAQVMMRPPHHQQMMPQVGPAQRYSTCYISCPRGSGYLLSDS